MKKKFEVEDGRFTAIFFWFKTSCQNNENESTSVKSCMMIDDDDLLLPQRLLGVGFDHYRKIRLYPTKN